MVSFIPSFNETEFKHKQILKSSTFKKCNIYSDIKIFFKFIDLVFFQGMNTFKAFPLYDSETKIFL